jgi:hypothetical protein
MNGKAVLTDTIKKLKCDKDRSDETATISLKQKPH